MNKLRAAAAAAADVIIVYLRNRFLVQIHWYKITRAVERLIILIALIARLIILIAR